MPREDSRTNLVVKASLDLSVEKVDSASVWVWDSIFLAVLVEVDLWTFFVAAFFEAKIWVSKFFFSSQIFLNFYRKDIYFPFFPLLIALQVCSF